MSMNWSSTDLTMQFGYDGLNRLTEVTTPDGKSTEYTYNKNSQVTGMSGSVTKVLDEAGGVLWSSEYTAFGTVAGVVIDAADFPGMYTGKDVDAETGLTYHWNRWRSEDGLCLVNTKSNKRASKIQHFTSRKSNITSS
jgi:YD repeat-containing protein